MARFNQTDWSTNKLEMSLTHGYFDIFLYQKINHVLTSASMSGPSRYARQKLYLAEKNSKLDVGYV